MAVTTKNLSKLSSKTKELESIIREHLQIIDDKLLHSDKSWGRNLITHDLPTSFVFPGLEKKDAQRMIYSKILKSLEKRGFEVKILLETDRTILYIIWTSEYNPEELESMNSIIKSSRIQVADVEAFVAGLGRQPLGNNTSLGRQNDNTSLSRQNDNTSLGRQPLGNNTSLSRQNDNTSLSRQNDNTSLGRQNDNTKHDSDVGRPSLNR